MTKHSFTVGGIPVSGLIPQFMETHKRIFHQLCKSPPHLRTSATTQFLSEMNPAGAEESHPDISAIAADAVVIHDLDELKAAVQRFPESLGDTYAGIFYLFAGETLVAVCDKGYGAVMPSKMGPLDDPTACTIATEDYTATHKYERRGGQAQTTDLPAEPLGELIKIADSLRGTCVGCLLDNGRVA